MRMPWIALASGAAVFLLGATAIPGPAAHAAPAPVSAEEATQIATDTYLYAYPLVLMEVTRRVGTNVAAPDSSRHEGLCAARAEITPELRRSPS